MRSVISASLLLGVTVATSEFPGSHPISTPYYYSEINSLEFEDSSAEHQSQNDNYQETRTFSQVVSTNSLDGGCFVSAQAIMCSGGGADPMAFVDIFESEDDFSDEDDDEDDDGHSSMLSNASLRRSKVLVGGQSANNSRSQSSTSSRRTSSSTETTYFEGEVRLQQRATAPAFIKMNLPPSIWGLLNKPARN